MIDSYSFGKIIIKGKEYRKDIKIINGEVIPNWWRKEGHNLDIDDIKDIINFKPDILIIGSGALGLMKVKKTLVKHIKDIGIEVKVLRTSKAVIEFNLLFNKKNIAGAFHLTC